MKPMSSMWSASSRTRNDTWRRSIWRCSIKSSKRPGVATKISTPCATALTCGPWPTPPNTTAQRMREEPAYDWKLRPIWAANSRVGASTSAFGARGMGRKVPARTSCANCCKIGSAKAAVFPVPVWAVPKTSRPSSAGGIACSWMDVGFTYPAMRSASLKAGSSAKSWKVVVVLVGAWLGAAASDACAGCLFIVFWPSQEGTIARASNRGMDRAR